MNERMVRVFVKGDDLGINFDLVVDQAMRPLTGQGASKRPGTGWWGKIRTNDIWPFILFDGGGLDGGRLDFGASKEDDINDAVRYADTDILKISILRGASVSLNYGGTLRVGAITNIVDLLTMDNL